MDYVLGQPEGTVGLRVFYSARYINKAAVGGCHTGLGTSVVLVRYDDAGPLSRRQYYHCSPGACEIPVRTYVVG